MVSLVVGASAHVSYEACSLRAVLILILERPHFLSIVVLALIAAPRLVIPVRVLQELVNILTKDLFEVLNTWLHLALLLNVHCV